MMWIWIVVAGLAAALSQPGAAAGTPDAAGPRVGVLTFNIRYGTAPDKENAWPLRKDQVFDILRDERLGFIGLQEALRGQLDDIHAACPRLGEIGVGREDGKQKGEYAAILYRADQWKPLKSGTFWLSETPNTPGSMSWKTACTRVCTWAKFERVESPESGATGSGPTKHAGSNEVWVFNTHMDHVSAEARSKGARLIARHIADRGDSVPFVLTGDFNSGEDEEAARYFLSPPSGEEGKSPIGKLVDTFRALHGDEKVFSTFHAFHPERTTGKKIDYVLVPPGTRVIDSWIDRRHKDGPPVVSPSDHFAVGAIVEFSEPAK